MIRRSRRRSWLGWPGSSAGALIHRRYSACIRVRRLSADEVMARVTADPDRVPPSEFARFTKRSGDDGVMRSGDEDGGADARGRGTGRCARRGDVEIVPLVTLRGHLEAGQIEFCAGEDGHDLVFTIGSWASGGDRLSQFLYERVRMAKEVQLKMRTSFLENVANLCGGRLSGGIDIQTRRVDPDATAGERPLGDPAPRTSSTPCTTRR